MGLRAATVEDARDALARVTQGTSASTAQQRVLRVRSLLGYAHKLGYTAFNAGVTIKVRSPGANRGANLAKRIISEVEVGLLIRGARTRRDRVLLQMAYAGGLRVSELVASTWCDVLLRDERVQLSVSGRRLPRVSREPCHRIGFGMRTARMRSIEARAFPRCRPPWATTTSQQQAAASMPGRIAPAD